MGSSFGLDQIIHAFINYEIIQINLPWTLQGHGSGAFAKMHSLQDKQEPSSTEKHTCYDQILKAIVIKWGVKLLNLINKTH